MSEQNRSEEATKINVDFGKGLFEDKSKDNFQKPTEPFENSIEEKLKEEIAKLKDTVIRKVADADNLRKRLEKEKVDSINYANTKIAKDLLPTLDNFQHILSNMPKDNVNEKIRAIFDGIVLCEKGLLAVLRKHGISKIETKTGDDFNHQCHQAMCEVEDKNVAPGKVVHVMQDGYMYNNRLLRPAMVSVAKK